MGFVFFCIVYNVSEFIGFIAGLHPFLSVVIRNKTYLNVTDSWLRGG